MYKLKDKTDAIRIIGYVISCMAKEGKSKSDRIDYQNEAMRSNTLDGVIAVSERVLDELNGESER